MTKKEILDFLKENHLCFMATVDGNRPRVRAFDTYRADEDGIIYFTNKQKDVYKQIADNPEIEVCYHDANKSTIIRVSGRLETVDLMDGLSTVGGCSTLSIIEFMAGVRNNEEKVTRDFQYTQFAVIRNHSFMN